MRNKLILGNSNEIIKSIPDKSVDCVYTDVPYLMKNGGGSSKLGQRIEKNINIGLAKIKDGIDYSILDDFVRVMKKINCFIWCSKLQILDIMNYFMNIENREVFFEILVWCKTNPTPQTNNTWLPDLEYCLYFREKGVKLNGGYDLKSKWFIEPINKPDKDLYKHPTIKPLSVVEQHLKHATQKGDLILDPFLGSGTTALACKNTERDYIGIEIDENYYKIAQERLLGIDQKGGISLFGDFDAIENYYKEE